MSCLPIEQVMFVCGCGLSLIDLHNSFDFDGLLLLLYYCVLQYSEYIFV